MKSTERLKKTLTEIQQALNEGQLNRAETRCQQGLKRHPRHPLILSSLARAKVAQNQPEEARRCSDRALENGGLKYPSVVHHHLELLEKEKDFEGMLDVARRSLPVSREPIKSKRILARALIKANRRREALGLFEEILKEAPDAGALNDCCHCLYDLGQHEAGFVQNKLAATLEPDALWIRSNLILLGHYLPSMTKEDFIGLHKDWFDTCARLYGEIRKLERRPLEGRKLRIGFISNGFWSHPAGWLSYGAIAMLAHYFPCEIHLYSTHPPKPKDGVAQRFGELPVTHTALHGWSFNAKLQKLLEDELDVLVEMSGHSEHSALPLVAARVAPVQVKWIGGLSDTSAAPNMDYLLTDWIETPAGSEDTYTENLIRLPGGYVSYAPPAYMPEVNPLPAQENGYITFGCFNNLHKINPQIIGLWARILEALPESRLMLKDRRFEDPNVTAWVQQTFQSEGIPAERLILEKASPHAELLRTYNRIDIALDPWPYTGGLTTIEALFMGVPVVTCPGPSFAGRHAASHLTNAGLPEWVAQDFDNYKRIALDWANRLDDLAELRRNLRSQFQKSPLSGHVQFAANLLHVFQLMHQQWAEGKAAAPIEFSGPVPIPESTLNQLPENFYLKETQKNREEVNIFERSFDQSKNKAKENERSAPCLANNDKSIPRKTLEIIKTLLAKNEIKVVDVGANPIDGDPPYKKLIKEGFIKVYGFEPQKEAYRKLISKKGEKEYYFPFAIGTGEKATLYHCRAPGMTSTLKPNKTLLDRFQGYPIWAEIKNEEIIETKKLDDVNEIEDIDWLKIDIQGGELSVFKNGEKKLKETVIIQTEVNFIQLYEKQPLFAEIDQWMRAHGFMLHALLDERRRLFKPLTVNGQIHEGLNQITTADAVYIRKLDDIKNLNIDKFAKLAYILHSAYQSYDLSKNIIDERINAVRENFIVGCGHSGTTLLANILASHDEIYTPLRETEIFLHHKNEKEMLEGIKFEALTEGKNIFVEKTPRHVRVIKKICEFAPKSKIIAIVRDGRDVAVSLMKRSEKITFGNAIKRWVNDNNAILNNKSDMILIVRYEDLIQDTKKELKNICDFIGVSYTDRLLDFHTQKRSWFGINQTEEPESRKDDNHDKYRSWQVNQPIFDGRMQWKGVLSKEEESAFWEGQAGKLMRAFGYETSSEDQGA